MFPRGSGDGADISAAGAWLEPLAAIIALLATGLAGFLVANQVALVSPAKTRTLPSPSRDCSDAVATAAHRRRAQRPGQRRHRGSRARERRRGIAGHWLGLRHAGRRGHQRPCGQRRQHAARHRPRRQHVCRSPGAEQREHSTSRCFASPARSTGHRSPSTPSAPQRGARPGDHPGLQPGHRARRHDLGDADRAQ